jgi:hypothetical protein
MGYGRGATADELKTATAFLEQQTSIMAKRLAAGGTKPPMPTKTVEGMDPARAAALCGSLPDAVRVKRVSVHQLMERTNE